MCGRYFVEPREGMMDLGDLIARIKRRDDAIQRQMKLGEVFPTDIAPVIVLDQDQTPQPQLFKWGFSRYDGKGVIINARSETAAIKPMFQKSIMRQRCLIPAAYYFEWEKKGKDKTKYKIRPKGQGMITMAGIYRHEKTELVPVFVILTRAASGDIRFIHDRMPVIIPKDMRTAWLQGGGDVDEMLAAAEIDMDYKKTAS